MGWLAALACVAIAAVAVGPVPTSAAGGFFIHGPRDLGGAVDRFEHSATRINDRNRIVGFTWDIEASTSQPWVQWVNSPWAHPRRYLAEKDVPVTLNDRQQILISSTTPPLGVLLTGTRRTEIPATIERFSVRGVNALNDQGTLALALVPAGADPDVTYVGRWDHSAGSDRGRLRWVDAEPGLALEVNDNGVMVGLAVHPDGTSTPAIWRGDGQRRLLPVHNVDAVSAGADAINRRGDVVGTLHLRGGRIRPVLWRLASRIFTRQDPASQAYREIDIPPGESCIPRAINDHLVVVGWCVADEGEGEGTAFAWHPDRGFTRLPPLVPGEGSRAHDINKAGWVVGDSRRHPVIWRVLP